MLIFTILSIKSILSWGFIVGLIIFLYLTGYVFSLVSSYNEPRTEEEYCSESKEIEFKHKYTVVYNSNGGVHKATIKADSKDGAKARFMSSYHNATIVVVLKSK